MADIHTLTEAEKDSVFREQFAKCFGINRLEVNGKSSEELLELAVETQPTSFVKSYIERNPTLLPRILTPTLLKKGYLEDFTAFILSTIRNSKTLLKQVIDDPIVFEAFETKHGKILDPNELFLGDAKNPQNIEKININSEGAISRDNDPNALIKVHGTTLLPPEPKAPNTTWRNAGIVALAATAGSLGTLAMQNGLKAEAEETPPITTTNTGLPDNAVDGARPNPHNAYKRR